MKSCDAFVLFRRCLARQCSEDWHEFVDRYGPRVRRIVSTALRQGGVEPCKPDLDELVQELYFRLLTKRRFRFEARSDEELWGFMGRVAFNLVIDQQRARSAKKRQPSRYSPAANPRSTGLVGTSDPEWRLLGKERREIFLRKCLEVTRCDRVVVELQVLAMALLEGWSSHEITTQIEGFTARQVDCLVHRFRRHLAKEGIRLPRRVGLTAAAPG
ncbi:MAG: hypothetical protein AAF560_02235 [Acidobacteriota bacterium]